MNDDDFRTMISGPDYDGKAQPITPDDIREAYQDEEWRDDFGLDRQPPAPKKNSLWFFPPHPDVDLNESYHDRTESFFRRSCATAEEADSWIATLRPAWMVKADDDIECARRQADVSRDEMEQAAREMMNEADDLIKKLKATKR